MKSQKHPACVSNMEKSLLVLSAIQNLSKTLQLLGMMAIRFIAEEIQEITMYVTLNSIINYV